MKTDTMPPQVVKLLRGEVAADSQWTALTALGLDAYRDGKAGRAFEPVTNPGGLLEATERVNRFLLACWTQGREKAGGTQA